MAKLGLFALGVLTGLAFALKPRYAIFRDQPRVPEDWAPKFRRWENGVKIEGSWE